MATSWSKFFVQCKSSLSGIARACFLGRSRWKERAVKTHRENVSLKKQLAEVVGKLEQSEQQLQQEAERFRDLSQTVQELRQQVRSKDIQLLRELINSNRPEGMQYSAKFMELAVNLVQAVGLHGSISVMKLVFGWLGMQDGEVCSYQAVRTWMQRLGLHRMTHAKKHPGGAWLVDHTVQNGDQQVLVINRVSSARLRKSGPLKSKDLEPVGLMVGKSWKKEDVGSAYQQIAAKCGMPEQLICDGADNLRNAVKSLANPITPAPLVFRDVKHFLANRLEDILTKDPNYELFTPLLKKCSSAIQQTEMAHLTPRSIRSKSRFMNMGPVIRWAQMILWQLKHPGSKARRDITVDRFESKFSWLKGFQRPIGQWFQCQQIINSTIKFVAQGAIRKGAWRKLAKIIKPLAKSKVARNLVKDTLEFLRVQERPIRPGQTVIMSTEILESSFASYKALEKQHSKTGFTSLILAYPALLKPTTAQEILKAFKHVKVKDVQQWVEEHLGQTTHAKRQVAYREARNRKANAVNQSFSTA